MKSPCSYRAALWFFGESAGLAERSRLTPGPRERDPESFVPRSGPEAKSFRLLASGCRRRLSDGVLDQVRGNVRRYLQAVIEVHGQFIRLRRGRVHTADLRA